MNLTKKKILIGFCNTACVYWEIGTRCSKYFLLDNCASKRQGEMFSSKRFRFLLSVSISYCSLLISICMLLLTLSLLMSYVYGAPFKAKHFKLVYIWTYVWQRRKPFFSICCTMFQHWIKTENYPVEQLCINTLLATKATLITDGI
jgi:hypothetical protein